MAQTQMREIKAVKINVADIDDDDVYPIWQIVPLEMVKDGIYDMKELQKVITSPHVQTCTQLYGEDDRGDKILLNPMSWPFLDIDDGFLKLWFRTPNRVTLPRGRCPYDGLHSHKDRLRIESFQSPDAKVGYELLYAAQAGCAECTTKLVENGVNVNFRSLNEQYTPLAFAEHGFEKATTDAQKARSIAVINYLKSRGGTK